MNEKFSAVLIPIVDSEEPFVLLTQRNLTLGEYPGQICLPGGRVEAGETFQEAALREFSEELGVAESVTLLGALPSQMTSTGYTVYPFYGLVSGTCQFQPSHAEVSSLIHLPLSQVLNVASYVKNTDPSCKIVRHGYCLRHETHFIWGVTATILKTFAERCSGASLF